MTEKMQGFDLSRGVVPVVLCFGMFGAVGAGGWWASGVSRDLQGLAEKIEPLSKAHGTIRDNSREVEHLKEEIRKLERDLAIQKSRAYHLAVEVGVEEKLKALEEP